MQRRFTRMVPGMRGLDYKETGEAEVDVPRRKKKPCGFDRNVQDLEKSIRHSMELVFPCG